MKHALRGCLVCSVALNLWFRLEPVLAGARADDLLTVPGAARLGTAGAAEPVVTTIAFLRSLLDPVDYVPTDTTTLHTVEGVVTTHVNLTGPSANALFYLQDASGGIAVYWSGATNRFVPQAGDAVRVTAPLTQRDGLLELAPAVSKPQTSVTLLSTGNLLPTPIPLDFGWKTRADLIEPFEGSYVVVSNVVLEASPERFKAGSNVTLTNEAGDTFTLWIDGRTDIAGQPKPGAPVTIVGVLGQYDTTTTGPRTDGYEVIPTRLADLHSATKAPGVWFTNVLEHLTRPGDAPTNSFSEVVLRPGESLTLQVAVVDTEGGEANVAVTGDLPPCAQWTVPEASGSALQASFRMQPTEAEAGHPYLITLSAWNQEATNTVAWTLYVPTLPERGMTINEYLANPTSVSTSAFFNPLRRTSPAARPSTEDEYVELLNGSNQALELAGWTLSDSNAVRLRFTNSLVVGAGQALIACGGALETAPPDLDVPVVAAHETAAGLSLNNDGDAIVLRNAAGNLVERVVYSAKQVAKDGSMTRWPDATGPFVAQTSVAPLPVSPGRTADGLPFVGPPVTIDPIIGLTIDGATDGTLRLHWAATNTLAYTVWVANTPEGPYEPLIRDVTGAEPIELLPAQGPARFFRVSGEVRAQGAPAGWPARELSPLRRLGP